MIKSQSIASPHRYMRTHRKSGKAQLCSMTQTHIERELIRLGKDPKDQLTREEFAFWCVRLNCIQTSFLYERIP